MKDCAKTVKKANNIRILFELISDGSCGIRKNGRFHEADFTIYFFGHILVKFQITPIASSKVSLESL